MLRLELEQRRVVVSSRENASGRAVDDTPKHCVAGMFMLMFMFIFMFVFTVAAALFCWLEPECLVPACLPACLRVCLCSFFCLSPDVC